MHFLWLISVGEGYELLKDAAHKGLKGLKVAPFYGCQILRPSKLLGFEDPDKPESLERIIAACGGEAAERGPYGPGSFAKPFLPGEQEASE